MEDLSKKSSRKFRRKLAGSDAETGYKFFAFLEQAKLRVWFDFLRISPSYGLAKKILTKKKLTKFEKELVPPYLDLVIENYKEMGDVWGCSFSRWEFQHKIMNTLKLSYLPKTICYLDMDDIDQQKKVAVEAVERFIENEWLAKNKEPCFITAFSFNNNFNEVRKYYWEMNATSESDYVIKEKLSNSMKNKDALNIQKSKLRWRNYRILRDLVVCKTHHPEYTTWQLAKKLKISMNHVYKIVEYENKKSLVGKNKDRLDVTQEKMIVNAIVGRYFRNAFLISENAAMGKFPLRDNKDVDFKSIKTQFNFQNLKEEIERLPKRPEKKGPNNFIFALN